MSEDVDRGDDDRGQTYSAGVDAPIDDAELVAIFSPLLRAPDAGKPPEPLYPLVLLAVSGGGDSLALLHLFARWRQLVGVPAVEAIVVTVDHDLRSGSADEARFVAAEATSLCLAHETLLWAGDKPRTGLQNAAREARYRLILDRARRAAGPVAVLTAHTRDDQAETFLMRLARGSGVDGLAGMAPARTLYTHPRIELLRPLLDTPGARLRATLHRMGRTWLDDPTNANLDHERPRLRAARPHLAAAGLSDAALVRSAARLRRSQAALAWATRLLAERALTEQAGAVAHLDRANFDKAPIELRTRLLVLILARYGGIHPRARLTEVERLATRIDTGPLAATLGGCRIAADPTVIRIEREPGRNGLPHQLLAPGQTAVWDNRFEVTVVSDGAIAGRGPLVIRALSTDEWALLRHELPQQPTSTRTVLTLPAAFAATDAGGQQLVANVLAGGGNPWFIVKGLSAMEVEPQGGA